MATKIKTPLSHCYMCGRPIARSVEVGRPPKLPDSLVLKCEHCRVQYGFTLSDALDKMDSPSSLFRSLDEIPHVDNCQCSACRWLHTAFGYNCQKHLNDLDGKIVDVPRHPTEPVDKPEDIIDMPKPIVEQQLRLPWSPRESDFLVAKRRAFFQYPKEGRGFRLVAEKCAEVRSKKITGWMGKEIPSIDFEDPFAFDHPAYELYVKWAQDKTHKPLMPETAQHMKDYIAWAEKHLKSADFIDRNDLYEIKSSTSYGMETYIEVISRFAFKPPQTKTADRRMGYLNQRVWRSICDTIEDGIDKGMAPSDVRLPLGIYLNLEGAFSIAHCAVAPSKYLKPIPVEAHIKDGWFIIDVVNSKTPTHKAIAYTAYPA